VRRTRIQILKHIQKIIKPLSEYYDACINYLSINHEKMYTLLFSCSHKYQMISLQMHEYSSYWIIEETDEKIWQCILREYMKDLLLDTKKPA
jgi:hypothetical protein